MEQDGMEQDGREQDGREQDGMEQDGIKQDGLRKVWNWIGLGRLDWKSSDWIKLGRG